MDRDLLLWIHGFASPGLDRVFVVSDLLGTSLFLGPLVAAASAYWWSRGRRREALLWIAVGLVVYVGNDVLKELFGRPRPMLWPGPVPHPPSLAFPSGHALAAAALFPLGARSARLIRAELAIPAYVAAALLALYVGLGRLYLGVHWPTDVLAGWAIGALLVAGSIRYAETTRARKEERRWRGAGRRRAGARRGGVSVDPKQVVEDFVEAWNRMDLEGILDAMAEDVHYHNVPLEPLDGKAAVREYLEAAWRFEEVDWEMLNLAVAGDVVLTERVDRFVIQGSPVSLPVMGAFEIRDGKIAAWRDYFDLASYRAQLDAAQKTNAGRG